MRLIGRPDQRALGLPNVIIERYLEVLAEMVALMMRLEGLMTTGEVSVCEDEAEGDRGLC